MDLVDFVVLADLADLVAFAAFADFAGLVPLVTSGDVESVVASAAGLDVFAPTRGADFFAADFFAGDWGGAPADFAATFFVLRLRTAAASLLESCSVWVVPVGLVFDSSSIM